MEDTSIQQKTEKILIMSLLDMATQIQIVSPVLSLLNDAHVTQYRTKICLQMIPFK